jgi:hypothetical protein
MCHFFYMDPKDVSGLLELDTTGVIFLENNLDTEN